MALCALRVISEPSSFPLNNKKKKKNIMDKVFIVYEVDQNDETTILKVFSDCKKALSYQDELRNSRPYDHFYCDVWEITE